MRGGIDLADLRERIEERVQLAAIYLDDGAPLTAAQRLRDAAVMCQQLAGAREAALQKLEQGGAS